MKNIQKILFLLFLSIWSQAYNQVSIDAGTGILSGFGTERNNYGFHLGVEVPRSSDLTFFLRGNFYLPVKERDTAYASMTAINLNTQPYTITVPFTQQSRTIFIEGGTRSYLINDYDNGFSVYGGSVFGLGINTRKANASKFDVTNTVEWEGKYELPNANPSKGSIYFLGVGLQGGIKYTIPIKGTIFFDMTGVYSVLNAANNDFGANSLTYAKLNFLFHVGYRKDLY